MQINTSLGFNRTVLVEMSCVRHQREVCHFHRKGQFLKKINKRMHGLIFITRSITCIWKIDRMTLHIMPTLKESYIQLYNQHLWQDVHYHRKFNKFVKVRFVKRKHDWNVDEISPYSSWIFSIDIYGATSCPKYLTFNTNIFFVYTNLGRRSIFFFFLVTDRCFWNIPLIRMTKLTIYNTI